mgnify:FL=1
MKLVKIDHIEENGGEFALKQGDFMVILTGPNTGEYIDGRTDILPNFKETDKSLKEIFGEDSIIWLGWLALFGIQRYQNSII